MFRKSPISDVREISLVYWFSMFQSEQDFFCLENPFHNNTECSTSYCYYNLLIQNKSIIFKLFQSVLKLQHFQKLGDFVRNDPFVLWFLADRYHTTNILGTETISRTGQESKPSAEFSELMSATVEDHTITGDRSISQVCPTGIEICIDGQKYVVREQPVTPDGQVIIDGILENLGEHLIFTDNVQLLIAERSIKADHDGIGQGACQAETVQVQEDAACNNEMVVLEEHKSLMDDADVVEIQDVVVNVENSSDETVVCISESSNEKDQNIEDAKEGGDDQLVDNASINLLRCQYCTRTFQKRNSFLRHVRTHTGEKPFTCDICGKGFSQDGHLRVHKRIHNDEKKFSCDVCGKSFAVNSNLKTHKRIHSGEKPYKCNVCGMGFNQSSSMKVHRRSHDGEKPFSCDKCGKKFTRRESLRYHQNTHEASDRFECEICMKRFASSTYLKRHLTCHSDTKEFRCVFCGRAFSLESNLKTHLRLHSGERPYKCTVCDERFMHSQTLKAHLQTHGLSDTKLCEKCGLQITQSCNAKEHVCSVEEKSHCCEHCGKSFGKSFGLKRHMQSHNQGTKLACEICGKAYRKAESLKNHMRMHEGFIVGNGCLLGSGSNVDTDYQDSTSEGRTANHNDFDVDYHTDTNICHTETKSTLEPEARKFSGDIHTNDTQSNDSYIGCDNGKEVQSEREAENDENSRTVEAIEVSLVSLATLCENALQKQASNSNIVDTESCTTPNGEADLDNSNAHEFNEEPGQSVNFFVENVSDSGKVNYLCNVCGEAFAEKSLLYRHLPKHIKKKPFACAVCGGGFSQRCHLKVHQRTHSGDKGHSCEECGKVFTVKSNLKTHMRIHSGEKPYVCDVCGMGFNQSSSMKVHRRSHSGEKPFVCDICGKGFTRTGSLRSHKKAHTGDKPFKCDLCEKAFTNRDYLKLHRLAHSEVKPFSCSICEKRFAWRANLRYHMKTHEKERSFKCGACKKAFGHSGSLKLHIKTFHTDLS